MKQRIRSGKAVFAIAAGLAVVLGATLLVPSTSADGRPFPPGPQCGPTYQWSCSGVGGPDRLFIGTVCEKNDYEAKTGLTCVPI